MCKRASILGGALVGAQTVIDMVRLPRSGGESMARRRGSVARVSRH